MQLFSIFSFVFTIFFCFSLFAEDIVEQVEVEREAAKNIQKDILAIVNGEELSLRKLENELLKREGAEMIEEWVHRQMNLIPWEAIRDDEFIIHTPAGSLSRVGLASQLLQQHGGDVREELINLMLIEQELAVAKITLNQEVLDEEWKRLEKNFTAKLEKEGKTIVPFDNYIEQTQGMSIAEWQAQPGFRLLAGAHQLVYRSVKTDEKTLRAFYNEKYGEYIVPEAYKMAVMFFPYPKDEGQGAQKHEQQKSVTKRLADDIYCAMIEKRMSWQRMYRGLKPDDASLGQRGWVAKDGKVPAKGLADIPRELMRAVFKRKPRSFPQMIGPIEGAGGLSILYISDYRAAVQPDFEAMREELHRDLIDRDLDAHTKTFLANLRQQANIEYQGMAQIIERRSTEAQDLGEKYRAQHGLAPAAHEAQ